MLAVGWLGYVKGDVAEVERVMEESLAISRELDDAWCIARAQAVLGTTLAAYTNDSERTVAVLQEALEIARPLGDTQHLRGERVVRQSARAWSFRSAERAW